MKKLLLLLPFLIGGFFAPAQVIRFGNEYPIWSESAMNNFQQTSDGGYILCTDAIPEMDTASQPIGRGYLVKMDAQGATQWIKSYPKTSSFVKCSDGNSVCQTSDGGYIIATAYYTSATRSSIYLIKTDNAGNFLWSKRYFGMGSSSPFCIKQTSDLGYIVCGLTTDTINQHLYAYLLKTDNAGNPQWGNTYAEAASGQSGTAYHVEQTSDGGYIVSGKSYSGTFVMKTNSSGAITWTDNVGTTGSDELYCVKQTVDGGYIASGTGFINSKLGIALLKLDGSGNSQWKKLYTQNPSASTSSTDQSFSVEEVPGGYTVLVFENDHTELMKTDASGNFLWANMLNSSRSSGPTALERTSDGGYAFDQLWYPGIISYYDVAVIKTDSLGRLGCNDSTIILHDTIYTQQINPGFITNNISPVMVFNTVFTTVSFTIDPFCGNAESVADMSQESSISIFPNPTSGNIFVQGNSLTGNKIELEVRDVLGQTLLKRQVQNVSGNWQEELDLSAMANGVYFVSVKMDDGRVLTKKVVKGN